jgi:hypothetical protein
LIGRINGEILQSAAAEFLSDLIGTILPTTGGEELRDVISRKLREQIIDGLIRLRAGCVKCKYSPASIGVARCDEALTDGARRDDPLLQTPTVHDRFAFWLRLWPR